MEHSAVRLDVANPSFLAEDLRIGIHAPFFVVGRRRQADMGDGDLLSVFSCDASDGTSSAS